MSEKQQVTIEVCVEGIDGLVVAQENGADRVELCASLLEGGLTPSLGTVRTALRLAKIPFHVIVRPRGGDFLYTDAEFESMVEDVRTLRDMGVRGVVIGMLTPDGRIDEARTARLVKEARPMSVTCHRAFDMTPDPAEALEALIRCGIDRVLTSGQRDTAVEGLETLTRMNALAGDRIVIMGCGALSPLDIGRVRKESGLRELHFASLHDARSPMVYRNPHVGMGGTDKDREYTRSYTDPELVRETIAAARRS